MDFSDSQYERYARHLVLPELGGAGQQRLLAARVLVVGAGGLGAPLISYLAAAGVGTLGIADDDQVSLSNLQRQVIHGVDDLGARKVDSAARHVAALNPDVAVQPHGRLGADDAPAVLAAYDLVVDGSDNFDTRYALNDAAWASGTPLISAAIFRFDGQIFGVDPGRRGGAGTACYRCLYPEPPPPGTLPSCAEGGVLGALAGLIGAWAAVEALKTIAGIGTSVMGKLLLVDAFGRRTREMAIPRDPGCAVCAPAAPAAGA